MDNTLRSFKMPPTLQARALKLAQKAEALRVRAASLLKEADALEQDRLNLTQRCRCTSNANTAWNGCPECHGSGYPAEPIKKKEAKS